MKSSTMASSNKAGVRSQGTSGGENANELRDYRIHERIGQDDLSHIYRATHQTFDQTYYVHLLRHGRQDWISVSRFNLIARLGKRLSHPNLLRIDDAGHDERFGHFYATLALDARRLSDVLAEGALPPVLALKVAGQIAEVIDYLHREQVIHRDVQPANILLTPEGRAFLTNLSFAASSETPDFSSIDEADYLTPYAAPEQRLDNVAATAALDVYGFGATVFHMFSGQLPPAPGEATQSVAIDDPALSSADRVLRRMLDAEPEARFPSAGAAVSALRQSLRSLIDLSTDDMEESRWEARADWLENPLETVLAGELDDAFQDFLRRSHQRADKLHRQKAVRTLLSRWGNNGVFRRSALGKILEPELIVSYNVYFYDLRTLYETRSIATTRVRPAKDADKRSVALSPDVWDVDVPEPPDAFASVKAQDLVLPNSTRVITCSDCSGGTKIPCNECQSKGTVERVRKVRNQDGTTNEEKITSACAACRGYGTRSCPRCDGSGNLVEEQIFSWSRRAKLWQNTDDIDDLPVLAIQQKAEQLHTTTINPYEARWHSVAPLAELLRTAISEADDDTRLIAAELSLKGTAVTEVDYQLNEKSGQLAIVGFDEEVIGDWSLLNPERIGLAVAAAIVVLVILGAVLFAMLG
jgi:serine/threonine protein kinase